MVCGAGGCLEGSLCAGARVGQEKRKRWRCGCAAGEGGVFFSCSHVSVAGENLVALFPLAILVFLVVSSSLIVASSLATRLRVRLHAVRCQMGPSVAVCRIGSKRWSSSRLSAIAPLPYDYRSLGVVCRR